MTNWKRKNKMARKSKKEIRKDLRLLIHLHQLETEQKTKNYYANQIQLTYNKLAGVK